MRGNAIRAKVYRASSHRDVQYDGRMKSIDKRGDDDDDCGRGGASTVTCGGMCADGWGKYREGEGDWKSLNYTTH